MFFDTRSYGEDVWIKDDVVGVEIDLVDEQIVASLADFNFTLKGICLTLFVEGHHDGRGSIGLTFFCMG